MNFLREFFSSGWNWFFIVLFLSAGVFYLISFSRKIRAKEKELEEGEAILEKYNAANIDTYYSSLDAELSECELLKPLWNKYKKSLAFTSDGGMMKVYSTIDASEYVYSTALLGGLNAGFWSGLAGLFTGIGILGTFLGLTVGLADIDTSSTSTLSSSITGLLGGMSTAFVTSLIGIFCAIPAGFIYHRQMDEFQGQVDAVADQLDAIFPRTNVESIMLSQLAEVRQERTAIQQLSTDLAISICDRLPDVLEQMADRMDQAVKGNLDTMLDGLSSKLDEQTDKLEQMANRMDQTVKGSLDDMLGSLSAKLDEQTGKLEQLATRLDDHRTELEKVAENTKSLANGFGEAINEGAGKQAQALGGSLAQLSLDIKGLSNGITQMISESRNTAAEANEKMLQEVEKAVGRLDVTMEGILAKQTEKTDENIQKMTALMSEMKDTMGDIFQKMADSSAEQLNNNAKASEDVKQAIEEASRATADNLSQMNEGVKAMMAGMAAQLATAANEQAESQRKAGQDMENAIQIAGQATKANLEQMNAGVTAVMDAVAAKLAASADEQAENQRKAGADMEATIKTAGKATEENLAHINDTVTALMEKIAKQMEKMQGLMDAQENRLQSTLAKMDRAVSSSGTVVESAGKVVAEFSTAAEQTKKQFTSAAKEAADTIKGAAVPFDQAARPLKDAAASLNGGLKTLSTAMDVHKSQSDKITKQLVDTAEKQQLAAMEIEDSLKTIQTSWRAYESHFKTVDSSMAKIFADLERGLNDYNKATSQGLTDKLKAFDKELSGAIKDLANINAETTDVVSDLTDAVKKMRR